MQKMEGKMLIYILRSIPYLMDANVFEQFLERTNAVIQPETHIQKYAGYSS